MESKTPRKEITHLVEIIKPDLLQKIDSNIIKEMTTILSLLKIYKNVGSALYEEQLKISRQKQGSLVEKMQDLYNAEGKPMLPWDNDLSISMLDAAKNLELDKMQVSMDHNRELLQTINLFQITFQQVLEKSESSEKLEAELPGDRFFIKI